MGNKEADRLDALPARPAVARVGGETGSDFELSGSKVLATPRLVDARGRVRSPPPVTDSVRVS